MAGESKLTCILNVCLQETLKFMNTVQYSLILHAVKRENKIFLNNRRKNLLFAVGGSCSRQYKLVSFYISSQFFNARELKLKWKKEKEF